MSKLVSFLVDGLSKPFLYSLLSPPSFSLFLPPSSLLFPPFLPAPPLSSPVYNRFKQSDRERTLFSLKGQKNVTKRMTIYTFLLSHMADEHRSEWAHSHKASKKKFSVTCSLGTRLRHL